MLAAVFAALVHGCGPFMTGPGKISTADAETPPIVPWPTAIMAFDQLLPNISLLPIVGNWLWFGVTQLAEARTLLLPETDAR